MAVSPLLTSAVSAPPSHLLFPEYRKEWPTGLLLEDVVNGNLVSIPIALSAGRSGVCVRSLLGRGDY